jgi:hypothetical protein
MKNIRQLHILPALAMACLSLLFTACSSDKTKTAQTDSTATDSGANLTLPAGFSAAVIAHDLGSVRHIAITPQGGIYVKHKSAGGNAGILYLTEANGAATVKTSFGTFDGTGIYVKNGYLYASSDEEVFRFKLNANNEVESPDKPEKIVTGLNKPQPA